jgi:hypothetical protein
MRSEGPQQLMFRGIANSVATACRRFIAALSHQLRKVTSWLWRLYRRVETHIAALIAEIFLLIFAIRVVLILILIETALVYLGFRTWWYWLFALILGVFILSASAETMREWRRGEIQRPVDEWAKGRAIIIRGVRLLVRLSVTLIGAYVTLRYIRPPGADLVSNRARTLFAGTTLDVVRAKHPAKEEPPERVVPYSTDFTRGLSGWKTEAFGSGSDTVSWDLVLNNGLRWQATGGAYDRLGESVALRDDPVASNVSVGAEITVTKTIMDGHHSGIVARFLNSDNYYELFVNRPSHRLYLSRVQSGKSTHIAIAEVRPADVEQSFRLKLECWGITLKAFLNGRVMFVVEDTANDRGQVGLINLGGVTQFSHFAVGPGGA